ncbi:MAG: pyridoxamine 5-phosphate oxidase-related FMN-binding protein, partial [Rhodospirillales bacterium]|nr:pyridoxamine 5-phosphate oxidase-related FMN-binding protein [Rhodospirillales bacterium]
MSTASPFALTPEIIAIVAGAFDSGNILLLAAVDKDRKPVLSFRGSTSVFSDAQLSFWARNAEGGTIEAIKDNSHVALMYRSQSVPLLQFIGRAQIVDSPAERNRAYDLAPEKERAGDPERKGRAVIVDLDEVKGVLG